MAEEGGMTRFMVEKLQGLGARIRKVKA